MRNGNFAAPVRIPFMCGSMEKTRMILWILKQARTKRTKARIIVDSFETDPAGDLPDRILR